MEFIDLLPLDGRQGNLQIALESDQLKREHKSGRVFAGLIEAPINSWLYFRKRFGRSFFIIVIFSNEKLIRKVLKNSRLNYQDS